MIDRLLRNKYAINFILIPIIYLVFLPTFLIKSLYFVSIFYDMTIVLTYPIYLSIVNFIYHKDKLPIKFLSNSYLMILASILNFILYFIGSEIPYFIKETPRSSEQSGFFILFFISGLIITIICVLITYITLIIRHKNLSKIRIQSNDELRCIYIGSIVEIDYLKNMLIENGINSMINDSNKNGEFRLYTKWIDLEKAELIVNDFMKSKK
jgi:hypothetical protein